MKINSILSFAILTLAANASVHAEEQNTVVAFRCDNGQRVEILRPMTHEHPAQLLIDGQASGLAAVPSANGELFRDGPVSFHTTEDDGTLQLSDGTHHSCLRETEQASSSFIEIRGEVALPALDRLPNNAKLTIKVVRLNKAGKAGLTLAEQELPMTKGQAAVGFHALVDRGLVPDRARMSLIARIEDRGRTIYRNATTTMRFHADEASRLGLITLNKMAR